MSSPQHNTAHTARVARIVALALACAWGAGEAQAQTPVAGASAPVEVAVASACGGTRGRARLLEELKLRVEGLRTFEGEAEAADAIVRWVIRWAPDARGDCVMTLADERSVVVTLPLKADSSTSELGEATVRAAWFISTIEPRPAPASILAPAREPFTSPQDEPQNPETPMAVAASTSAEQTSRQGSDAVDPARDPSGPPKRGEPAKPAQKAPVERGFWGGLGTRIGGWFDQTARTTRRIGAGASRTAAAIERRGASPEDADPTLLQFNASLSTSARQGTGGDPMWFVGARLGAVIHDSFGLGIVYQKLISDNRVRWDAYDTGDGTDGSFKTGMDLNLLGVDMEYILFPHNRVYAVFNVMAGAGIVEYQSNRVEESDRLASMLLVDTSAQVMVKIDTWFEIGAGFGFRGATVYPTLGARSEDFTGFSGMLTLRMPVF